MAKHMQTCNTNMHTHLLVAVGRPPTWSELYKMQTHLLVAIGRPPTWSELNIIDAAHHTWRCFLLLME